MRNRILAMTLVAGCVVSTLAHALGLGDIEVYSALNQPLVAEIALSSVRPGETDNMRIRLADEDAFMQAGVERPFYLTKLKFNLAVKPDGTQYINVTTNGPVREPFLNFLVDVDWPRGRLVREYTVLLDPPVFAGAQQAPAPQAETPSAATAAATNAAGSPALIKRDETAPAGDEFGFDEQPAATEQTPLEEMPAEEEGAGGPYAAGEEFGTPGSAEEEGLGVMEKAEPADFSSLPDIEMTLSGDEAAEQTATEATASGETAEEPVAADTDEFASDETSSDLMDKGAADDFVFEGEETPAASETPYLSEEGAAEEPYLDEQEETYLEEEQPAKTTTEVGSAAGTAAVSETELPDINLFYDASLPYDEAATNALLAQFTAEDEARARGEQVSGTTMAADEHRVEAGDTLYDIASRYKAPDVTVDQAMLSILRYNPDAFIRDNINSVKKGFVLRVPDRESMLQIDSSEALAEVRRQYALWREYRNQLAGAPSTARDAQAADRLDIAERGAESSESGGELSILSPGRDAASSERASGSQEGSDSGSSLSVDLQLAREQLQAERLEKKELQARLTDLTGQIEKMDRLISLKDEQLAQLQQRLSELGDQTTPLPDTTGEPEIAGSTETTNAEQTPEEQLAGESPAGEEFQPGLTLRGGSEDVLPEEGSAAESEIEPGPESEIESGQASTGTAESDSAAAKYGLDFEKDFENDLQTEQPLTLQPGEQATAPTEQETAPEQKPAKPEKPVLTERRRPQGLAAYIYDLLPAPYNIMAVDFLESDVGYPILAGVGALLLLLLILAFKPKKKKPARVAPAVDATVPETETEAQDEEEGDDVHMTVEPAAPSFGERLSAMFAPITGIFSGSKKPSGIAAIAAQADHSAAAREPTEHPEEGEAGADAVIEDLGEIESFEETAKSAAEQASTDTGSQYTSTQKRAPAGGTQPKPAAVAEEVSDDTTQEADVYLAYGLHDQAEELLTQALASSPGKVEYQGKLLETYFAAGKKSEFETLASDLQRNLAGRSSRIWDKAIAMGKEIAPDNPLFSDVADTGLKVSDFAPAKPETADLDLSESPGATTPDIEFAEEDEVASTTTDFDLDLSESEEPLDDTFLIPPGGEVDDDKTQVMQATDVDEPPEEIERHDTDLQFDLETDADADEMSSDLNIDFNADELGLDTEIDADTSMEEEAVEIDVDDATVAMEMPFDIDDESDSDAGMDDLSGEISLEDGDDDVFQADDDGNAGDELLADLDLGGDDDLQAASVDTEFEIPDDEDTLIDADLDDETISGDVGDEVSTKLDLAKAYMDMGDYDGASSTLEEVMAEGDDAQRKEAEELLEQIH